MILNKAKLKTFSIGGVHPADSKYSAQSAIETLELPKVVTVPVSQHIGAPAEVVVERGDMVKAGQIIASSQGFVSTNIHAPVSGKVGKIEEVVDSSGYKRLAVNIRVKGDEWADDIDTSDTLISEISLSPKDMVTRILEKGVVGMGGAAFPAHVKLSPPADKNIDTLLINGVECEPYLTADHRLMLEKAPEIMVGIRILMKILNVERAIIGIENNKSDAIQLFESLAKDEKGMEVQPLKVQYPQGGEKQLIQATLNREVPSGGLPMDVGAVVHNIGTTFAIYEAVQKNKPLVERIVTVTGKSVSKPSNFKVRIGTPVSDLIEAAGGLPENTGKIISGGPMMGKALSSIEVPVAKGTSGILLIPMSEASRSKVYNCLRCGKCIEACPMGLEPYNLLLLSKQGKLEKAAEEHIMDCIECGSCSFTCPSNQPVLDYLRLGKIKIKNAKK